jgi:glycosyltransferase involved in cell wall biosynthesis
MTVAAPPVRKVLMTLDAVGGVWRYALDLAEALGALGVAVVFAGFGPQPSHEQRAEARRLGTLVWLDAPLDWIVDDAEALAEVPTLLEELAVEHAVDLLHLNLPSQAAGLSGRLPVVAVSHSCVVTWFAGVRGTAVPEAWAWQRDINLHGLQHADAVLVPSRSHGEMVERVYGVVPGLFVVPNASRVPATLPDKRDMVFAAGRWWDEGKNGAVLDTAAPSMRWPLVMVGPDRGPGGQTVTLNHADHRGSLSHADTMALMAEAAIVVSPSLYEPFGLAALEAALSGAALVLSDIPTYRELWDGVALFADPADPAAFSAAVNRLAEDPELRHALALKAQVHARQFSPMAQADAMLGIYRRAAAAKRSFEPAAAAE